MKSLTACVAEHKRDRHYGIYAVCSAHPLVLEAAMLHAAQAESTLLIEATSNQVDQFGGYTGMTPAAFCRFVGELADRLRFPRDRLLLGGDHPGPNRWQMKPSSEAMALAEALIHSYVAAGFSKIHLDCSMSCADDPVPLTDEIVAQRAARLAGVAERACAERGDDTQLVYVIGSEVPVPGGAQGPLDALAVTTPQAARATLAAHRQAFAKQGLSHLWPRIIGLVVQPGVEFDHAGVSYFRPEKSLALSQALDDADSMVFEAHSTDYQTPQALRQLVQQHFAILKVGPALTFALREALFALAEIERGLLPAHRHSGLRAVLEDVMLAHPDDWQQHYRGSPADCQLARGYSYSDRVRYYWPHADVDRACRALVTNLTEKPLPLPLISQYLPLQYPRVRAGAIAAYPHALIIDHIQTVLRQYHAACRRARSSLPSVSERSPCQISY